MQIKDSQSGQSIIEILVATLIVGLVLTAIASSLTFSIRNASETRQRELATNLAQEGTELYRRERDQTGWQSFIDDLESNTYCLNNLPENTAAFKALQPGPCATGSSIAGTAFTREVLVSIVSSDSVRVTVTVSWQEGAQTREVVAAQTLHNLR